MNYLGAALVRVSENYSRIFYGHESLAYTGEELQILCLSSDNDSVWYHPTEGRIYSDISREDGSVNVEQNPSYGLYKLVFEGELSPKDEGVYSCRIGKNKQLTFGIYNNISKSIINFILMQTALIH